MPPNMDETNAADNARAASPRFDIGKPSITVACELAVPGIPIKTDGKVSDVAVTDWRPIIMASAKLGSTPNRNGKIRERPAVPPRPGKIPTHSPKNTPPARAKTCVTVKICDSAANAASSIEIGPPSRF